MTPTNTLRLSLAFTLLISACGGDSKPSQVSAAYQAHLNNDPIVIQGKAFLAKNSARPEVVTTSSGLQYEVLVEGHGARPSADDFVRVHYHGTLIDGSVFDSSVARGKTLDLNLKRVIGGWREGIQTMKAGGKSRLYIPPNLAYGPLSPSPAIPSNSTLIFEIELFEIISKAN